MLIKQILDFIPKESRGTSLLAVSLFGTAMVTSYLMDLKAEKEKAAIIGVYRNAAIRDSSALSACHAVNDAYVEQMKEQNKEYQNLLNGYAQQNLDISRLTVNRTDNLKKSKNY